MRRFVKNNYMVDDGEGGFYIALVEKDSLAIDETEPILLNSSAYEILRCCDTEITLDAIIEYMSAEYNIDEANVADIVECVEYLLKEGLITEI